MLKGFGMPFLSVRNLIWSAFFVLFASSAVAEIDQTYQVYEKNGDYYLKTDPTWVPIGVSNFVIIPVCSAQLFQDTFLKECCSYSTGDRSPLAV